MLHDIEQEHKALHDEILTTLQNDAAETTNILLSDTHETYSQTEWTQVQSRVITHLHVLYKNALSPHTDDTNTPPMKRR